MVRRESCEIERARMHQVRPQSRWSYREAGVSDFDDGSTVSIPTRQQALLIDGVFRPHFRGWSGSGRRGHRACHAPVGAFAGDASSCNGARRRPPGRSPSSAGLADNAIPGPHRRLDEKKHVGCETLRDDSGPLRGSDWARSRAGRPMHQGRHRSAPAAARRRRLGPGGNRCIAGSELQAELFGVQPRPSPVSPSTFVLECPVGLAWDRLGRSRRSATRRPRTNPPSQGCTDRRSQSAAIRISVVEAPGGHTELVE